MFRPLLVALLALALVRCSTAETQLTIASPEPLPPTASASPLRSGGDLAWTPLSGLDLRGAYVASGATSGPTTVLVGAETETGALVSWTSDDGAHWQRHWLDGTTFGGAVPSAMVAGGPGFVALGWRIAADLRVDPWIWTSTDGVDWSPDPDSSGRLGDPPTTIAGTASSIVVATCCNASGGSALRTSSDGISWQDTTPADAERAYPFHLAATGDGYLAVSGVDQGDDGGPTVLNAWRSADGRTWAHDAGLERSLAGLSGVNDVLAAGEGFAVADDRGLTFTVAGDGSLLPIDQPSPNAMPIGGTPGLGWLDGGGDGACSAAWLRAGGEWWIVKPHPAVCATDAAFDRAFALPDGWLVVAAGDGFDEETVWAIRPEGAVPAADAPAGPVPAPPPSALPVIPTGELFAGAGCPTEPATLSQVIDLEAYDRAACFSSRELTFRAWVVDPGEGYGGTCPAMTPRWLLVCVLPDWMLAADSASADYLDGLKHPDAGGDLTGVGRWVEVTGHFNDPAATTCRIAAGPASIGEPPPASFVLRCREQFAVTRIETAR